MIAKYAAGLSISLICSRRMPLRGQRFIHMMAYIAKCLCLMLCLFSACYFCRVSTWLSVSLARSGRQLGRPGRRRRPAYWPVVHSILFWARWALKESCRSLGQIPPIDPWQLWFLHFLTFCIWCKSGKTNLFAWLKQNHRDIWEKYICLILFMEQIPDFKLT